MNIYLEAFVDTNFGDNLFIHTVVSRYPQHTFFILKRNGFELSYQILQEQEPNVIMVSPDKAETFLVEMDAMMVVGGDIFGEHTDYGTLLANVRRIKEQRGYVFFLGLSLLESYEPENKYHLKLLFTWADAIVVRESQTAVQVKQIAPGANVIASTDMAFTTDVTKYMHIEEEPHTMGISVRRKIPRNTEDMYPQYCEMVARTVKNYLGKDSKNKIRFLAFSKGTFDDEVVAEDILKLCPKEYQHRVQHIPFNGNVDSFIKEIQRCESLLCTRFHGIVFAILLRKSFVPIVYEEKTKRLLKEIGYNGIAPSYEEYWDEEDIRNSLYRCSLDEGKLTSYLNEAQQFFVPVDRIFNKEMPRTKQGILWKKLRITVYRVLHKFFQ